MGYYEEHTPSEYLSLLQNDKIYDIIYYMVKESTKFEKPFKYLSQEESQLERCSCCNLFIPKRDLSYLKENGFLLCKDCIPFFK